LDDNHYHYENVNDGSDNRVNYNSNKTNNNSKRSDLGILPILHPLIHIIVFIERCCSGIDSSYDDVPLYRLDHGDAVLFVACLRRIVCRGV